MKKITLLLMLLISVITSFAQQTEFSEQDKEDIKKYFLLPNAKIFEAEAISHESYTNGQENYGIFKG